MQRLRPPSPPPHYAAESPLHLPTAKHAPHQAAPGCCWYPPPPPPTRIAVMSNGVSIASMLERGAITSTATEPRLGRAHTSTFWIRAFASHTTTLGVAPPGDSRSDVVHRAATLGGFQTASSRAAVATMITAPIAHRLRRGIRMASRRKLLSYLFRCSRAQVAPVRVRVSLQGWRGC